MTIPGQGIAEAKRELRRRAAAARDRIPAEMRRRWSAGACMHAVQWMEASGAEALASYASFRSELDTGELLARAWERGLEVLLPRVDSAAGELRLIPVASWDGLKPGAFGIMEPAGEIEAERAGGGSEPAVAAVFVPGLAFDALGGRLGYGRGFYDRLYESWMGRMRPPGVNRPIWIGLAFGMQMVDRVPSDDHDAYMDMIITEQGILDCRKERE